MANNLLLRRVGLGLKSTSAWLTRRSGVRQETLPPGGLVPDCLAGEVSVLIYNELVARTAAWPALERLHVKLGFPVEVFDTAVQPVLEGYAEFVQLLPAREVSPPLSRFARSLDVAVRALDLRRGQILPRGAVPEVIGAQMHRWTYALFIASLLHGIDKALAAYRITMRCRGHGEVRWVPEAGSMRWYGALSYRAEAVVHDARHSEPVVALSLLDRLVPRAVLEWLAIEPEPMRELRGFLTGDLTAQEGAIAALVARALRESRNEPDADLPGKERGSTGSDLLHCQCQGHQGVLYRSIVGSGHAKPEPCGTPPEPPALMPAGSANEPQAPVASRQASKPRVPVTPTPTETVDSRSEYLEDFAALGAARRETGLRVGAGPAAAASLPVDAPSRRPVAARCRPSPEADRFMDWLQSALADGSLPFNEQGALVHFVPEGMLLVSPRIFREFAVRWGEDRRSLDGMTRDAHPDIGKAIQRDVLRTGWHLRGPGGVNILTYQVLRAGAPVSRLSAVLIRQPERFVSPVPPANPLLVRITDDRRRRDS